MKRRMVKRLRRLNPATPRPVLASLQQAFDTWLARPFTRAPARPGTSATAASTVTI